MIRLFLPIILGAIISLRGGLMAYEDRHCEDIVAVGAGWWADWSVENRCPDVQAEFVPHVCCAHVPDALPEGTKWAMGPNEVNYDLPGSTCPLTPARAAEFMRRLNEAFPDVRWVSPSVSACYPGRDPNCLQDPLGWMAEYMALCPGCQQAIAVHWYCYDNRDLATYLDEIAKHGLPVWLTEWGCNDLAVAKRSLDIVSLKTARHAWFALRLEAGELPDPIVEQTLVDSATGILTEFGNWYGRR